MRLSITFPDGQPGLVEHLEQMGKEYRSSRIKLYAEIGYMDITSGTRSDMMMSRLIKAGVIEEIKQHIYEEMGIFSDRDKKKVVSLMVEKVVGQHGQQEEQEFEMDAGSIVVGTSG